MPNASRTEPKTFIIGTDDDGRLQFIYDDEIAFLNELGESSTQRASHVEPDGNGQWTADMSPVGGPVLGPFNLRGDALIAEVVYLQTYVI